MSSSICLKVYNFIEKQHTNFLAARLMLQHNVQRSFLRGETMRAAPHRARVRGQDNQHKEALRQRYVVVVVVYHVTNVASGHVVWLEQFGPMVIGCVLRSVGRSYYNPAYSCRRKVCRK